MNKLQLICIIVINLLLFTHQQKIGISRVKLDSMIDNVVWCGTNRVQNEEEETIVLEDVKSRVKDLIFLSTTSGEVYATNNHGEQWANYTKVINQKYDSKLNKTQPIFIKSIQVSAANSKTVFLFGNNGQSFVAERCGKKLSMFQHDPDFEDFKLNRMNQDYILAHKPVKCNQFDDECEEGERQLFVSKDLGQSWTKILDNVYTGQWDKLIHFALVPDDRIVAHQRIYYSGKNNDVKLLTYSDDLYTTKKQIDSNVLHFYQSTEFLYILTEAENANSYSLKLAPAFTQDYKPQEIDLPVKRIKDHSFTVLDSFGGQVYIAINHEGSDSKITNVYHSDYNGKKFSLSLMNVVRNQEGNVDFEKIQSNDGTFIANVYDSQELERIQENKKQSSFSKTKSLNELSAKTTSFTSISSIQKTKISFNRGSTWHSLKAPLKDSLGKDINCSGDCSLHLKGRTDKNGNPLYTSELASGLILATGNTGVFLEEREESLNTYLSNDGGHNWLEIKKYPHIYEIGDRGGIIVIARSDKATDHINYSWDHGKSWEKFVISDTPMDIINIVTESSNMNQRFLLFGKRKGEKSNKMRGFVISLDFSKLNQRVCKGHWDPLDPESDFEFWTPINFQNNQCTLGTRYKYIRRKSDVQCFNPEEFDTIASAEPCECTEEDFECIFGYYRDSDSGNCIPLSNKFAKKQKETAQGPPNPCNGYYLEITGYQKTAGNFCQGGVDLGPIKKECPVLRTQFDPKVYIPLEEDVAIDLDKVNKPITKTTQESSGINIFNWILILIILAITYWQWEFIINILISVKSLTKRLLQKEEQLGYYQTPGSGRLGSNYENLGLVGDMDQDDEEEQL